MPNSTTIYKKTAIDNTLILTERGYFVRQTNVGTAWTDLRMGMYIGIVPGSGSNDGNSADETVTTIGLATNMVMFGLKDSGSIFPKNQNSLFIGVMTSGSTSVKTTPAGGRMAGGDGKLYGVGFNGTGSVTTNSGSGITRTIDAAYSPGLTLLYCSLLGLRLLINNRGQSNQSIDMWFVDGTPNHEPGAAGYSTTDLRGDLANNAPNMTTTSLARIEWNDGVNALPVPDSLFIYIPFSNSRVRISAMGAYVFG
jgi:hypothetical protein